MDITPGDVVNAGVNVLTVYLLVRALNRIDELTDRVMAWLERGEAQRQAIMRSQGINPHDSGIYRRRDLGLPNVDEE